tara:strand:+ start:4623 stop:7022 length:2400 start_codon:yes stop_codon:yes gene_type:complete
METSEINNNIVDSTAFDFKDEFFRYFSFWPFFLVSLLFFVITSFVYLRYSNYYFKTEAKIEIIDKAQDSEMALPTAMTVFNRSMINLENEIGVLTSRILNSRNISLLKSNVLFYSDGLIRNYQSHKSDWISNSKYKIEYKIDTDTISESSKYKIIIKNGKLNIDSFDKDDNLLTAYNYPSLSTKSLNHDLPFELELTDYNDNQEFSGYIQFNSFEETLDYFTKSLNISETLKDSDQLNISLVYPNKMVAEDYINSLIIEFDNDGIADRQLEYKRTIDFVDSRSIFLRDELSKIEDQKEKFKQKNKLTDVSVDASVNIEQKYTYNSELFDATSQLQLVNVLSDLVKEDSYNLLPLNIGIEDLKLNSLLENYNELTLQRENYLMSAGINNSLVKNLELQIDKIFLNIIESIESSKNNLELKISKLEDKEREFENVYDNTPRNEKILRGIERELEVKEALFLLLLQKREEAAINYAVIKPSIKVIDYAKSLDDAVSPNVLLTYLVAVGLGLMLPFILLYFHFSLDNKIHTKKQLTKLLNHNIPVIAEVPFIREVKDLNIFNTFSRDMLSESIRMLNANISFLFKANEEHSSTVTLVTSSIKGEGKTLISVNYASSIASGVSKVLLLGADLRNPQLHKFFNEEKSNLKGISDYIYGKNHNWRDLIYNKDISFDILFSGTIPPNPTELLASEKFAALLEELKGVYDHIIIDSAPCLLVSDTFEISKYSDKTIYIVRANHTSTEIAPFINENYIDHKLPKISIVLNSVGSSSAYGYKYGYQYGYKYGYKYGYNYGYGYGYSESEK